MEKKVSYIIAVINEFALAHTLNSQQAYRYLLRYKGLEFVDKFLEELKFKKGITFQYFFATEKSIKYLERV